MLCVNLKGREPWGTVEPGAEYNELCQRIRSELCQLINPDTGKPAVSEAVQVSQIYQGENLINLPDIVIRWALGAPIHRLYHPRLGLISNGNVLLRTAQHTWMDF